MFAIIYLLGAFIADLFKPPRRLEVENLFLRHQLSIALRQGPQRVRLRAGDRALMVWMTVRWPSLLDLSRVVQPDTILRWHRAGFRAYWRWKSRARPGRPRVSRELRELIQRMSKENPLWGAPRIHGGTTFGLSGTDDSQINCTDGIRSEMARRRTHETHAG